MNFGQSTNDVYPTAFRLALILRLADLVDALAGLRNAFASKGEEFGRVLKMGRTHLQDAVPMSLGQELQGWGTTIGEEIERIGEARQLLHEINLGATAIGTSVTAAPGYPELAVRHLAELTGVLFVRTTSWRPRPTQVPTCRSREPSSARRLSSRRSATTCACRLRPASGSRDRPSAVTAWFSIMPGKVNPVVP